MGGSRFIQLQSIAVALFFSLAVITAFPADAAQFNYKPYEQLLENYVHEGTVIKGIRLNVVDYDSLYKTSRDPDSVYLKVLEQLSSFDPEKLPTREDQIAFWINAYNVGAIKMIIDHYPTNSIRSAKINLFKNPWGKKVLSVNGKPYSLGEIEHEMLIGRYQEKMAHFAIVCASLSCPDITKEVYIGAKLKAQMERQARRFLNNPMKGYAIDRNNNVLLVSKIFQFDKKSFSRGMDDIVPFISEFIDDGADAEFVRSKKYRLEFLDYDWDLNTLNNAMR